MSKLLRLTLFIIHHVYYTVKTNKAICLQIHTDWIPPKGWYFVSRPKLSRSLDGCIKIVNIIVVNTISFVCVDAYELDKLVTTDIRHCLPIPIPDCLSLRDVMFKLLIQLESELLDWRVSCFMIYNVVIPRQKHISLQVIITHTIQYISYRIHILVATVDCTG